MMYPIQPICEEAIRPHCGRDVLCVMRDGCRIQGRLVNVGDGNIHLIPYGAGAGVSGIKGKKAAINSKRMAVKQTNIKTRLSVKLPKPKAKVSQYPYGYGGYGYGYGSPYGYGYGGGGLILSLATIALLFAIL